MARKTSRTKTSTRSSTAPETFVDTSGFYALLVKSDREHVRAAAALSAASKSRGKFVTTDYVLDETVTLLRARGHGPLVRPFLDATLGSQACQLEWMTSSRFIETTRFMLRHEDKAWSFTDCTSFVVMASRGLSSALTKDKHFRQAGFVALLA